MSIRTLCDTNVLVSAFISGGPPSRVIEAAVDGRVQLVLADPVLDELARVLRAKLGFERSRVREIDRFLTNLADARIAAPARPVEAVTGDRDDDVVLACAIVARVEALVSGDRRHLLPVGEHRGVRVVTPQALLAELAGG